VSVDDGIGFQVEVVRPGDVTQYAAQPNGTRICAVAAGKLRVRLGDMEEFAIGPHGMFKILPGVACNVENRIYVDATLHITTVQRG